MEYKKLVDIYGKLEKTSAKLEKTKILSEFFKKVPDEELREVVLLCWGKVFPKYTGLEFGVATQLLMRAITKSTGISIKEIENLFKKHGDLGLAAEECIKKKKQLTLFKKKLTIGYVYNTFEKIAKASGEKSQDKKLSYIAELLLNSEPKEARYIVRTILGELRVGVAEGILRDSIAASFLIKDGIKKEEAINAVDLAWNVLSDFGEVALIAKQKGIDGLKKVKPILGRPLQVMLGVKAESIEDVLKRHKELVVEYKYDGLRLQCHKKGNKVWLFTRRQENVTSQFPEMVDEIKKNIKASEAIVEGEAWPIDVKTGKPLPFQKLSQRIQRKYDIEKMMKEIPVQLNLFDIVYLNGRTLFHLPLKERRQLLEKITKVSKKLKLAKQIITGDAKKIEEFYHEALSLKQEGIFLKNPESKYIFGRHVGGWYKIKPTMETLDLVIIGAEWGEGRRSKWLSSYILGIIDPDTGNFLSCGMMGTGLTEKQFDEMTKKLKPLIIKEEGKRVWVKPKIVVEVGYQEIQKSPNYKSGYALRFPRLVRIRTDKGPEDADSLDRLIHLYKSQGRSG